MKLHKVRILEREETGEHTLLRYEWLGPAPEPGQFVMARPDAALPSTGPFLSRPFFVHDFTEDTMSLLFKVRSSVTKLLAEAQSEVFVSEPRGRGFVLPDEGPVALVGSGVWVSPLKLLTRRLQSGGVPYETYLECPPDARQAYAEWLSDTYPDAVLAARGGSYEVWETLSEDINRYTTVYVSGSQGSLVEAKKTLAGRVPAQLAVRERMACATGSCYGCVVPVWEGGEQVYARSCIEGPIFFAEKLAW